MQARALVFYSPPVSGHTWGRRLAEVRQQAGSTPRLPTAVLTAQRLFWQLLSLFSSRSDSPAAVLAAQQPFWQPSSRSGSPAAVLAAQQPFWQPSSRSGSPAATWQLSRRLAAQQPPGSSAADLAAQPPIWQLSCRSDSSVAVLAVSQPDNCISETPKHPDIEASNPARGRRQRRSL